MPEFRPLRPFTKAWAQTIAAAYWPAPTRRLLANPYPLALDDGDRLILEESSPAIAATRVMIFVHGLTGSAGSSYMTRLSRKFLRAGTVCVRVNLRGCGPGFGQARETYHSGRSGDIRAVVQSVTQRYPGLAITLVGFSLGANLVLKMAGEDGDAPTGALDSVIAVSPPADLAASAAHLGDARNRFFDQIFVRQLRKDVARLRAKYPDLPTPQLPKHLSLREFDDVYTAPRGGFRSAADYYARSSALPWMTQISVRTLLLSAMDDPVIDSRCFLDFRPGPRTDVVLTKWGGHVGFLGSDGAGGVRWMDQLLLRWVSEFRV